jgi:hypothetical protein
MCYHAGMDVSLETANICIVGDAGTIREHKVEASPEALIDAFKQFASPLRRVGLEAGLHAKLKVALMSPRSEAECRAVTFKFICPPESGKNALAKGGSGHSARAKI